MGIIAIPGMMTGAILGGADVTQASRLQMIIMFMISASSALSCIAATLFTLYKCVDSEHRIRSDRIYTQPHALRRVSGDGVQAVFNTVCAIFDSVRRAWALALKRVQREEEIVTNGSGSQVNGHGQSERSPLLP
jgi:hypothetical protein